MKTNIVIFILIICIAYGCKKNDFKTYVWIYDSDYPELPVYSEMGYNTFGAYYDKLVFISNEELAPAKVIATNNFTSFELFGHYGAIYNYGDYNTMAMKFRIPVNQPKEYSDLISLNGAVIDLKDTLSQVTIIKDTSEYIADILSGELTFKKAQFLIVDKKPIEVILSGYLNFNALINNDSISVREGRFDVGVGPENFYVY